METHSSTKLRKEILRLQRYKIFLNYRGAHGSGVMVPDVVIPQRASQVIYRFLRRSKACSRLSDGAIIL